MLTVRDIDAFYGDVQALRRVTFEVREREIVAMVGANGAGKTTLLNTISGVLRPRGGTIHLGDKRIDGLSPHGIVEMGVVHVPEGRRVFPQMSVWENLMLGAHTPRVRKVAGDTLQGIYRLFPILEERKKQLAGTMSGGQQQMLAIGRGLMALPKVLMLDEPSLGLAPILVQKMFEVVKTINEQGTAVILVEQNVPKALGLAHRGYVLQNGAVVLEGSGQGLLQNQHLRRAYLGVS